MSMSNLHITLPESNSSLLRGSYPKKKTNLPTIHFQVRAVNFRDIHIYIYIFLYIHYIHNPSWELPKEFPWCDVVCVCFFFWQPQEHLQEYRPAFWRDCPGEWQNDLEWKNSGLKPAVQWMKLIWKFPWFLMLVLFEEFKQDFIWMFPKIVVPRNHPF